MSWTHFLGNKNKQVNQDVNGDLFTKTVITSMPDVNIKKINGLTSVKKTLSPKGLLDIEVLKDYKYQPMSAGSDDYLYGLNKGNKRMTRTIDGFETTESGFDFLASGIGEPAFVTKTPTGFLAYVNHVDGLTASIWHSQSFSNGFEKVLDLTNGYVAGAFVPRPLHNVDQGVVMVAEYTIEKDVNRPARAWISRRGGIAGSWTLINTVSAVDSSKNFHFHAVCYDPWQSRIYTSKGDYENRLLEYSDDWGKTWSLIETDTQPTLLEPMANRIVTAPDANDVVSINTIEKQINNDYTVTPFMKKQITISPISSYGNFGKGPVGGVVGSDEMYVTFAESGSKIKKCFIVATGDGGESWHLVYTAEPLDGGGLMRGLVTDPLTGVMYGYYTANIYGDGTWEHLARIKPIEWV
ncbi:hypothetical protein [Enterococcus faecium]|uniref:hypothetical protein n=1 Tax=Enterococcus faecium TaxID=1352 RepID=UPI0013E3AEC4|nr:hypothetical protein [Enterococcus faecium]